MVFEYSVGVDEIEDEEFHRPRQFGFRAVESLHVGRQGGASKVADGRPRGARAIAYGAWRHFRAVMAGPVPAIHVLSRGSQGVDARDKPGHDEFGERSAYQTCSVTRICDTPARGAEAMH
jgi:hypothetical protein